MKRIAMVLGHDLLIPNEDTRVYREAISLVNSGFEVTVFCWARRMDKYSTKWEDERDGIKVVRIFEDLKGGFLSKLVTPIKFGIGSSFGSGKQLQSWIHIEDLSNLILHTIDNNLNGIFY